MNIIDDVISQFDASEELYSERDVDKAIRSKLIENNIPKSDSEPFYDLLAFEFAENCQDKDNGWGTYFGPIMTLDNGDGTFSESPSVKEITPETINHWSQRAQQVKHPVLKTRYAHLFWEFTKRITGEYPAIDFARTVIDSSIELTSIDYEKYDAILFKVVVPKKLASALTIAISIKDVPRIKAVVNALIAYEHRVGQDEYPATWGFSFDHLIGNKGAGLSLEQKDKIVQDLESRLYRVSNSEAVGNEKRWCIEPAAMRLAQYYQRENRPDDAKRVIRKLGDAVTSLAENSAPLIASSHYEELRSIYQQYGLKDEANQLEILLAELGPKVVSEFKRVPFRYEIKQEVIEAYTSELLDGGLEAALARIAIQFIPNKQQAENSLKDIANQCPLSYSIRNQMYDHDGRLVANIDSIDNDLDGRLIGHISQTLQFEMPFLHFALTGLIEKYNLSKDGIVNQIMESPLFSIDKKAIIEAGIDAYMNDNHLVAAHLLIPQIEAAIRNLLRMAKGSIYRPNKNGGFDYRTLGDLLPDGLFKKIIADIFGDDANLYFRILFNEKRGWNIRNDICHGILRSDAIQKPMTDRIVHVLILLSRIRPLFEA